MYCTVPVLGLGQVGALAAIGIGMFWLQEGLLGLLAVSLGVGVHYLYSLWKGAREMREEGWL
ncbi:MAG: hypothetical protein N3E42_05660 [Candidatus Bipolaricaulota bacterium]|nr:hypothetical protein [Candidatus Bipolaricaulota bacterium]